MFSYALRALTEIKSHYAKIEKKALAIIWACEGFSIYTLGKHNILETDYNPLIPLLS